MPRHFTARLLTAACSCCLVFAAHGQSADFVLFGEPDAAAAAAPAEQQFVHPVTSPYFHENSFVTSDVRAWYVYHNFPNSVLGGDATVVAAQLRLALTDTLQLVAYKDGYLIFDDTTVNDEGLNDIAAGLKWNFYRDVEGQLSAAVGIGYELSLGDDEVLQDDEELRLWFSVDKGFDALHLGFTFNYYFPTGDEDTFGDSEHLSWHLHADYYVTEWFSPVVELNGYHTTDASSTAPVGFSGIDVANLGGGETEDVVSLGLGAEFRLDYDIALRAAYELPLTGDLDLYGDRLTVSLVWSF